MNHKFDGQKVQGPWPNTKKRFIRRNCDGAARDKYFISEPLGSYLDAYFMPHWRATQVSV